MRYEDIRRKEAEDIGLAFVGPYLGAMTRTRYTCPTHGEFLQTPNKFQQHLGCQRCGRQRRSEGRRTNLGQIRADAEKVGLQYLRGFQRQQVNAIYLCQVHGEIEMRPVRVRQGSTCRFCAKIQGGLKRRKPKPPKVLIREARCSDDTLTRRAAAVGLRYAGRFTTSNQPARYICEAHGEIEMRPSVVRRGGGCRFCSGNTAKSDERLREEAQQVGLTFVGPGLGDRTLVAYECPRHGGIRKRPGDVRAGKGCAYCARYGFDPAAPATFYVYRVERIGAPSFVGYGITKDHPTRHAVHLATFRRASAVGELLATFDLLSGRDAADLELHIRDVLRRVHIKTNLRAFKEEAVDIAAEPQLLDVIAAWIAKIRPT